MLFWLDTGMVVFLAMDLLRVGKIRKLCLSVYLINSFDFMELPSVTQKLMSNLFFRFMEGFW